MRQKSLKRLSDFIEEYQVICNKYRLRIEPRNLYIRDDKPMLALVINNKLEDQSSYITFDHQYIKANDMAGEYVILFQANHCNEVPGFYDIEDHIYEDNNDLRKNEDI